ncbi:MAG: universal stress protein [Deltaproteobacteria bacterium]|nr:universal stress protein [Deltaproteobacteria bacterium]
MTHAAQVQEDAASLSYKNILVAVDSSPHSERATSEAARLAGFWGSEVTGLHAFAARLHDTRFRQMEGSLPSQFQAEQELSRQRRVHAHLIGHGLGLISDSYLDHTEQTCEKEGIKFKRRAIEGKNYRVIVEELHSGCHDLLVVGSEGLGVVRPGLVGTVCQWVIRRTPIDTLVIKDADKALGDGPIVVAVDGSSLSFGGLMTATELSKRFGVELHIVAAFDPHFHSVAFKRISEVLSEDAGKVFHFREQEKLHSEIIDDGLAKVYGAHVAVAESMVADRGGEARSSLLPGKPFDVILKYVDQVGASLLVLGKTGIHADDGLDIGGVTEQLLHLSKCNVLVSCREHVPEAELVARETISWTDEAEVRLERAPSFVRKMARTAIVRFALEHDHTVITEALVDEAMADMMPSGPPTADAETHATEFVWEEEARAMLDSVPIGFMRKIVMARVEALALQRRQSVVTVDLVNTKYQEWREGAAKVTKSLTWTDEAYAAIAKAPDMVRGMVIREIEAHARAAERSEVSLEFVRRCRSKWSPTEGFHHREGRH